MVWLRRDNHGLAVTAKMAILIVGAPVKPARSRW
jgi:hypothetical protein